MCRILGSFGRAAPRPGARHHASALLFAGGPDDQSHTSGTLTHQGMPYRWLIGANRLAITDPVGGDQPYREDGSDRLAVLNGQIYNHRALRAQLGSNHRFVDRCDGRVILPLYSEQGLAFPGPLDGMFAMAVFDPSRARLVLATDPVGIKPLYYHWNEADQTLYFASEVPALLVLAGCPRELRAEGIDAYLTARALYGAQTMFRDVFRLPPGTVLVVEPGQKPRIQPYSRNPQDGNHEVMPTGDPDTDAALLRELLVEEVRSLLIADVPVATMNSGGLDSSLGTAIAARHHPGIHSFHIRYRGEWPADESGYARELATALGTTHHEIVADPADFPAQVGDVAWSVGLNADPIALSSKVLFRAVRRAGFKAILTGDGSDELFGGYARLADAVRDPSEAWAARYVDALAAVPRSLRDQLYTDELHEHIRTTGGYASAQLEERVRGLVRRHDEDRLAGLLAFEQAERLPAYHLARVDTTSMAHGVEARVPFLQGRVVRFARRLASEQKINAAGVKQVLYRAAVGLVPEAILRRPKQPFTLPVAAMLAQGQPLYNFARELLDPVVVRQRGFFKPQVVEDLLRHHGRQPEPATGLAVWSLLMLEAFLTANGLR